MIFNNGTKLLPDVFTTSTYDNINFQKQANLTQGGQIHIDAAIKNEKDYIISDKKTYHLWTKNNNSVYYDEKSNEILMKFNPYDKYMGHSDPDYIRREKDIEYETGGLKIRSIGDYLDNIIFHIFRDVGETVGENIIVDMKLIRDASLKGYGELRNILLGRYMYSPELS